MKVSVIIPVFNEEEYITPCLESLYKQTQPADEIIIIDNNCTDKTIPICKKYPNIKIVKEPIQGMIAARNRGFNSAQNDIIARCDADVVLPPQWIQTIRNIFEKNNIDALTGPAVFYDLLIKNSLPANTYSAFIKAILKGNDVLLGPNMILTKRIWNIVKNEVCLDDKKVHEDIDLTIHILKQGGKIRKEERLVVYLSGRRIKYNPLSFFGEYPIRFIQTFLAHV